MQIENGPRPDALTEATVVLMLELGHLGTRAKVSTDDVEVDTDKDMLHVSKDILTSAELKAISRHGNAIRSYVKARCLPSYLKGGFYLVPVTSLERIDAQLEAFQGERDALVEAFVTAYPARVAEARERLGVLYKDSDYPAVSRVREAFTWRARYLTFSTPSQLKGISRALFEREAAKAQTEMRAAMDDIKTLLRAELKGLVDHMVERLTPGPDGKVKVFRGSLVGNVKEFLELFDGRNVVQDGDLAKLAEQARNILDGVDAEALRGNEGLKNAVATGFTQLKAALDPLVAAKPRRMIDLES
jgi:hypothetical protein